MSRFHFRITDSFAKCGWLASIRGVQGGGLVEGLPTHTFHTDEGDPLLGKVRALPLDAGSVWLRGGTLEDVFLSLTGRRLIE